MKIDYAAPIPTKPHVLHVGLRTQAPKRDANGEIVIDAAKQPVMVDVIHECPVRKSHFLALGPAEAPYTAEQIDYACECELWHHKRDAAVRAKWDAEDQAVADAEAAAIRAQVEAEALAARVAADTARATARAAEEAEALAARQAAEAAAFAAKQAEYARLVVIPQGFVADEEGVTTGVRVHVRHQGFECIGIISADPANTKANALALWTDVKAKADAAKAALDAFALAE